MIWLDESGLLMAPLVRRSWAPKGQAPTLLQKAGHREKVSVAGAVWLAPSWDRLGLAYQTLVNGYYNNEAVAEFLAAAVQGLRGPIIVIWDGGSMHKGEPIRAVVAGSGKRLSLEPLPPHTPELMPMEQVWTWLKYGSLCNFAPANALTLNEAIICALDPIRNDQERLRNFFHASSVPLPWTLLI